MDHLTLQIEQYVICSECAEEQTAEESLRDVSNLAIGFTSQGIQVWCSRHNRNVCHVDFAGHRLTADFRCLRPTRLDHSEDLKH